MKLKEYQKSLVAQAINIIHKRRMVYLAMETRTGKRPFQLWLRVILPMKSGIRQSSSRPKVRHKSIERTFRELQSDIPQQAYILQIVSMDSLHKVDWQPNRVLIIDEAHGIGPIEAERAISLAGLSRDCIVIYLSAAPTPESYQPDISSAMGSPGLNLGSYMATKTSTLGRGYVDVKERRIAAGRVKDLRRKKK